MAKRGESNLFSLFSQNEQLLKSNPPTSLYYYLCLVTFPARIRTIPAFAAHSNSENWNPECYALHSLKCGSCSSTAFKALSVLRGVKQQPKNRLCCVDEVWRSRTTAKALTWKVGSCQTTWVRREQQGWVRVGVKERERDRRTERACGRKHWWCNLICPV